MEASAVACVHQQAVSGPKNDVRCNVGSSAELPKLTFSHHQIWSAGTRHLVILMQHLLWRVYFQVLWLEGASSDDLENVHACKAT
jgi:hypothetical protein